MEVVRVREETHIAEARRIAKKMALESNLTSALIEKAAIIATEAATNLIKHARQGQILLYCQPGQLGFLILDQGPGIPHLETAMIDGFSTVGSQGTGLGAMQRLATTFDIYTQPGKGTAIWVSLGHENLAPRFTLALPKSGEQVNGDGWATAHFSPRHIFLLVDGLGHGEEAHEAAAAAVQTFQNHAEESPTVLLNHIHLALKKTRGAAGAIAEINLERRQVTFVGIGNIHAVLYTPSKTHTMASMNGTLGHQIRTLHPFTYEWAGGIPTLIMHSDGLTSRWSLEDYPGLLRKPLPLLAGVLYRDFSREYDDLTVLTAKPHE